MGLPAAAQTQEPQAAPAAPQPPLTEAVPDELGRERDRMPTPGGAEQWPPGFGDAAPTGGNPDAVIQGGEARLPEGTNLPIAAGAGLPTPPLDLDLGGFVFAEFTYLRLYNQSWQDSFRPQEIDLELDARRGELGRVHVDLNVINDGGSRSFQTLIIDHLVEQAFAEWTPGRFTLRLGKMVSPFEVEPVDVTDRVFLSRSALAAVGAPEHQTGLYGRARLTEQVDLHASVANGIELAVDNNRSKAFHLGVPHRALPVAERWQVEGSVDFVIGAEQPDTNDLRWLLAYQLRLEPLEWLGIDLVALYGEEEHSGLDRDGRDETGAAALWYGGELGLSVGGEGLHAELAPLRLGARLEYLHDPDLFVRLPTPELSGLTTLVGTTLAARWELVAGLEAAVEYRSDFARGDVKNVSIQRNVDAFPAFWRLGEWFVTQQITVGMVGRF